MEDKNKGYSYPERALDVVSSTGIGASGGLASGALISRLKHGAPSSPVRLVHPNEKQLEQIQKSLAGRIKGFSAGVRGAAAGGAIGLAYGAYRASKKDGKPLPDALQIPGTLATAGMAVVGTRNRGKVIRSLLGKEDTIDMFRGYDDAYDVMTKKETWIPKSKLKDIDREKITLNEELMHQLRAKNTGLKDIPKSTSTKKTVSGRGIDEIWDEMSSSNSPHIKPVGGDPEAKVYNSMAGKISPVDINPDFTAKNISGGKYTDMLKTPNGHEYQVVRDMSVGGYELTATPEKNPEVFFKKINDISDDVKSRMGRGYDFSSPAIGPAPGKSNLMIADRRMAGGHIHIQTPIDDTVKYKMIDGKLAQRTEDEMREVVARRAAFVSMPFDMTHKAMPSRSGLYARTKDTFNEPYGVSIVSDRTMRKKPSWDPDKGYINFEHRVSPTYIGEDPKLNSKKVKLMQIINSNPEAAKYVDDAMEDIVKTTNNETQYLYMPEVREMVIDKYKNALRIAGVEDNDINKLLSSYKEGMLTKTSEDRSVKKHHINPILAAGILAPLAAVGGYKYFRRMPKNPTDVQKASKEGLTVLTTNGLSKRHRAINKVLISPDVNFEAVRGRDYVGNQVYKGTVYHKNWTNDVHNISRASGDVTINPPSMHTARHRIIDKERLSDLPGIGKYFGKSHRIDELLLKEGISPESFAKMTDEQAHSVLKGIEAKHIGKGKGFLKPAEGEAMGKGTDNIYSPVENARTHRLTKPHGIIDSVRHGNKPYLKEHSYGLRGVKENPRNYIMQENLNPGGSLKEYRIHTIDGKVLDSVKRFGALEGKPSTFFNSPQEKKEFEASLVELYKGIPEFSNASKKRQVALAFDAVRDVNGNIKLIEANPNSGFLFPPKSFSTKPFDYYSTHKMYKHLTGRDSGLVAGFKGTAIAGGVGAGAAIGANAVNEKSAEHKDKKKSIAPYIYGGAAGVGAGALIYALNKKPWRGGKMYEVVPSNWTHNAKGKGDIVRLTREELLKKNVTKADSVYGNYPARFNVDEMSISDKALGGAKKINLQKELVHLVDKRETYSKLPEYSKHLPKLYDDLGPEEIAAVKDKIDGNNLNEGIALYNSLMAKKNGLPEGTTFFVKDRAGYGSRGTFFKTDIPSGSRGTRDIVQRIYDTVGNKKPNVSPSMHWKNYMSNPNEYIVQEVLPKGREFRVLTRNGEVIGAIDRHGLKDALLPDSGMDKNQVAKLKEYAASVESGLRKDMKGSAGDTYFGHDIIIPDDINLTPRLVETNTQEGYHAINPNNLYKTVHGKDMGTVAMAKAVGGGVPIAAAAGIYKHKLDKYHEGERNER